MKSIFKLNLLRVEKAWMTLPSGERHLNFKLRYPWTFVNFSWKISRQAKNHLEFHTKKRKFILLNLNISQKLTGILNWIYYSWYFNMSEKYELLIVP